MRIALVVILLACTRVAFAAPTAKVTVESEPDGASIFVDDKENGEQGTTNTTLTLPVGDHTIIIEKAGYSTEFVAVTLKKGQRKPEVVKVSLKRAVGVLLFDGDVTGLTLELNDEAKGDLTTTLEVPADSYHVVVKRGDVVVHDSFITVDTDATVKVELAAGPKAGGGDVEGPVEGGEGDEPPKKPPGGAAGKAKVYWLRAAAATVIGTRTLRYKDIGSANLFDFDQTQPYLGLWLEGFPLAKMTNPLRFLSLKANLYLGIPFEFKTADASQQTVKTLSRQLQASVRYEYPFGIFALAFEAGYQRNTLGFTGTGDALSFVPNADMSAFRVGGGVRFLLGPVALFGQGESRLISDGGPYMARFGSVSGSGFSISGGAYIERGRLYGRFEATANRTTWDFVPGALYIATGATDNLTLLTLAAGARL